MIMLQVGIKGQQSVTVDNAITARVMGSGSLDVYATPAMIALIEKAAMLSVAPELEPGQGTVGTDLKVQHLASTPVGMTVTAKTELVEIDRRRLVFTAEVYDEVGLVGKGTHERFIIDEAKFQAKTDGKKKANA
jgi:fluoroacetyl-CoA thioesterase